MAYPSYIKDPDAVLDYGFDWSEWLQSGETVASASWTVPTGITKNSQTNSTTVSLAWLSGGTAGTNYNVSCKITTSESRIDERTMTIIVRNR
jgi:hypothetical protein